MNRLSFSRNIKQKRKIHYISGFNSCYGLGVDSNSNLFIPDFMKGIIYCVNESLNGYDTFFLSKNHLKKNNLLKSTFLFRLIKSFSKKNFFRKPHDIFFDKNDNFYITEMGKGNGNGSGNIKHFNNKLALQDIIGHNFNDRKGLVDPVMVYKDKDALYISEYGKSNILIYKKNNLENFSVTLNLNLDRSHAFKKGFDGSYYLADTWNHRVIKFSKKFECMGWIGKTSDGQILDCWTNQKNTINGPENGAFNAPIDIAFNTENIFISDCFNNRLVKIDYDGKFVDIVDKDLIKPYGIELIDSKLYIADKGNFRVKIIEDMQFKK